MLKCPNCDNTLDQDFGMVTCSSCQSVLMIDMTGEVRMGSEDNLQYDYDEAGDDDFPTNAEDDVTDPPEASFTAPDDFAPVETLDNEVEDDDLTGNESFDPIEEDGFQENFDPIDSDMDEMAASEVDETDEANLIEETNSGYEDSSEAEEQLQNLSPPESEVEQEITNSGVAEQGSFQEEEPEEVETFPMAASPDPEPVDITDYANSETSSLEGGELVYDVTISRLDSKDLKDALKYVLIDEKLKLNHHEYLKNIRDGKVTIPNLNPIKTKRIVEQLQYYAVNITWKQKRVVMEALEPETVDSDDVEDSNGEDLNV